VNLESIELWHLVAAVFLVGCVLVVAWLVAMREFSNH
jgi:hypothetical protein